MTSFEKMVYNQFLIVSRSSQNKPFKLRKDFEGFETNKDYIHLQRLCNLLQRTPEIDLQRFLVAPYRIWKDETYFDLKFYTTRKAIKAYNLYLQTLNKNFID